MFRRITQVNDFVRSQRAHGLGRAAQIQHATFQRLARRNQAARAYHHVIGNHHVVQDDRTDADQALIANAASMQHDRMPHRHIVANDERRTFRLGRRFVGYMAHGQVLHVGPATDHDAVHVAAQHRVAPDGTVVADLHVADDLARRMEKNALPQNWGEVLR